MPVYSDLTIEEITREVSRYFGIPLEAVRDIRLRDPAITNARHIAQYLSCEMTFKSKTSIVTYFKASHRSAIFYGFNKISVRLVEKHADTVQHVKVIKEKLASIARSRAELLTKP